MATLEKIKFTISPKGVKTIETLEGFVGQGCTKVLDEIELSMGSRHTEEEKKSEYFKSPDDVSIRINV